MRRGPVRALMIMYISKALSLGKVIENVRFFGSVFYFDLISINTFGYPMGPCSCLTFYLHRRKPFGENPLNLPGKNLLVFQVNLQEVPCTVLSRTDILTSNSYPSPCSFLLSLLCLLFTSPANRNCSNHPWSKIHWVIFPISSGLFIISLNDRLLDFPHTSALPLAHWGQAMIACLTFCE